MYEYPHENGDVIVLGPQVFVSRDEAVLNWKGRNYVSQAERDRLWAVAKARYGVMLGLRAERDRLRAVVDGIPVLVERTVRALQQTVGRDLAADPDTIRDGVTAALAAIQSEEPLDVSADMGWHCRCGTRYDVGQSICPDCGTARQRMPGSAESWDAAAGEKP
jgi:hypothetical protein